MRLVRNLTAGEIVGQVMLARDALEEWPSLPEGRMLSNIVMMGMGEPLYNFDNVRDALKIVMDGDGLGLSRRRITLSTSGVVPMMARAGAEIGVNLAVSLHAVTKEVRDEIVPLNRKYGIDELLAACAAYPGANNARRITFEYVMLKDKNDSDDDARELVRLIRKYKLPAKVNLIPFNPWPGRRLRMFGRGADPALLRHRLRGGDLGADPPPARPRHHGRLRPAQVGRREEEPRRARPDRGREAGGPGLEAGEGGEALQRLPPGPPAVDRMRLVGITERHAAIKEAVIRQAQPLADALVDERPGFLRAGGEAAFLREQHDRLHEHAQMRPLRRPEALRDREEQADRRAEQVEIAGELGEARGPVPARDADRRVELLARGEAAAPPRLAERGRIDREQGPLPRRVVSEAGADARLERGQRLPGEDVDMPGLQIAARGRMAGGREHFRHRRAIDWPVQKGPHRPPRQHRSATVAMSSSPSAGLDPRPPSAMSAANKGNA